MCHARNGATPTKKLFDYFSDISKGPLQSSRLRLVLVMHGMSGETGMHSVPPLRHSLQWEVHGCVPGKAGPDCSWEAFINVNGSKLSFTDFPLESTLSKPVQGCTLNSAWPWTYFNVEIPPNSATRNIRIRLTSNTMIAFELCARLGGLPSYG
ncbi:hypothetical protein Cgig2_001981 [Carnegiea gigantea]|uniref:Uncharacterized protein n=1 Tax=Carnegiea gigantea TaxID=171969 RepID=A0A9Q1QB92_9CARY|nr:hypothetical protein Cgig2_001981 [Carnegiea gigantea]